MQMVSECPFTDRLVIVVTFYLKLRGEEVIGAGGKSNYFLFFIYPSSQVLARLTETHDLSKHTVFRQGLWELPFNIKYAYWVRHNSRHSHNICENSLFPHCVPSNSAGMGIPNPNKLVGTVYFDKSCNWHLFLVIDDSIWRALFAIKLAFKQMGSSYWFDTNYGLWIILNNHKQENITLLGDKYCAYLD